MLQRSISLSVWLFGYINRVMFYLYIDIDECASIPCQNGGTCFDTTNWYNCTCAAGYTGPDCERGERKYDLAYQSSMSVHFSKF